MVILYFALNLVSNALSFDNCYCKTFSDVGVLETFLLLMHSFFDANVFTFIL